jgi:hypothetical protein
MANGLVVYGAGERSYRRAERVRTPAKGVHKTHTHKRDAESAAHFLTRAPRAVMENTGTRCDSVWAVQVDVLLLITDVSSTDISGGSMPCSSK